MNKYPLLFFILFGVLCGCIRSNLLDLPQPDDITKSHREAIGQYISEQILADPVTWPLLSMEGTNPDVQQFLDRIYLQATSEIRNDFKSPDSNRWSKGRDWKITVLEKSDALAFIVPGGDCYVSKGLLQNLENASQLYYILATEAVLLRDRHILKRLVETYSAPALYALATGESDLDPRLTTLVTDLPFWDYKLESNDQIKEAAMELICRTSIYDPLAGILINDRISNASQWLSSRPIPLENDLVFDSCGDLHSNGAYQKYVLDQL